MLLYKANMINAEWDPAINVETPPTQQKRSALNMQNTS